jgi:hypothetical protein
MCPGGQATIGTGGYLTERTGDIEKRTGGKEMSSSRKNRCANSSSLKAPRALGAWCD